MPRLSGQQQGPVPRQHARAGAVRHRLAGVHHPPAGGPYALPAPDRRAGPGDLRSALVGGHLPRLHPPPARRPTSLGRRRQRPPAGLSGLACRRNRPAGRAQEPLAAYPHQWVVDGEVPASQARQASHRGDRPHPPLSRHPGARLLGLVSRLRAMPACALRCALDPGTDVHWSSPTTTAGHAG